MHYANNSQVKVYYDYILPTSATSDKLPRSVFKIFAVKIWDLVPIGGRPSGLRYPKKGYFVSGAHAIMQNFTPIGVTGVLIVDEYNSRRDISDKSHTSVSFVDNKRLRSWYCTVACGNTAATW